MKDHASFSYQDMMEILDFARTSYKKMPSRARLPGMDRDFTVEEARYIALFDATLMHLNKKGVIDPEYIATNPVQLTQASSETIFDE